MHEPCRQRASIAQDDVWSLITATGYTPAYHVVRCVGLTGAVDVSAVAAALGRVELRHELLRAVFDDSVAGLVYTVEPDARVRPAVHDVRGAGLAAAEARCAELRRAAEDEPFELLGERLWRTCVIVLADDQVVLEIVLHHLIADDVSADIVMREVLAAYDEFIRPGERTAGVAAGSFAGFSAEERVWLERDVANPVLAYWRGQLADAGHGARVATAPWTEAETHRAREVARELPAEVARAAREYSQATGQSVEAVLAAAFAVLLGRYSGEDDVLFAVPTGKRTAEYLETVGFLVDVLPVRPGLVGEPEFRQAVDRTGRALEQARVHAGPPFEQLVRLAGWAPGADGFAVRALFDYSEVREAPSPGVAGLAVRALEPLSCFSEFDVDFRVRAASSGALNVALRYRISSRLDELAEGMLQHFTMILLGGIEDDARPAWRLRMLADSEYKRILTEWNDTACDERALDHPWALLTLQAEARPGAAAVVDGLRTLTFAQLRAQAEGFADRLHRAGIGPGSVVAIRMNRCAALVVAIFAVLSAEATFTLLDPTLPRRRADAILRDCGAKLILTADGERGGGGTDELPGMEVGLDAAEADLAAGLPGGQQPGLDGAAGAGWSESAPNGVAYIAYTSGSTTVPKGVAVGIRSLRNHVAGSLPRLLGPVPLRVAVITAVGFDAVFDELFAVVHGHQLVIVRETDEVLAGRVKADLFSMTPSVFRCVDWTRSGQPRRLLLGGEEISPELWAELAAATDVVAFNVYGITECTIDSSAVRIDGGERRLGSPLCNTRLHVVDRWGNLLPLGLAGELMVAGAGVARGYLDGGEEMTGPFLSDPFAPAAGARAYRTGDRVRRTMSGDLVFLDRIDAQIELAGVRIEPGEIETLLIQREDVREAAVVLWTAGAEPVLTAVVVREAGTAALVEEQLTAYLAGYLPSAMVPRRIVDRTASGLPLTPHGKIDRRALAEQADEAGAAAGDSGPLTSGARPRSGAEEQLMLICEQLFGHPVEPRDSFLDLGGSSLTAAKLAARLRREFGAEISLRAILDAPDLGGLAGLLAGSSSPGGPAVLAVPRHAV